MTRNAGHNACRSSGLWVVGSWQGAKPRTLSSERWMRRGQSMLEYALLVVAVSSAVVLMSDYVRRSLNGFSRSLQQELMGAEKDNRPR